MDDTTQPKTVSDVLQIADIALDTYDDIFSDFDPSPYTTRTLSVDFLRALSRRYPHRGNAHFVVNLTIPKALRSDKTEHLVKKRIKEYFRDHVRSIKNQSKEKIRNGLLRILVGALISVALLLVPSLEIVPVITILSVLIWYTLWSGFELIFEVSYKLKGKMDFAEKFMNAEYNFVSEEDLLSSMQKLQLASLKDDQKSQGSS